MLIFKNNNRINPLKLLLEPPIFCQNHLIFLHQLPNLIPHSSQTQILILFSIPILLLIAIFLICSIAIRFGYIVIYFFEPIIFNRMRLTFETLVSCKGFEGQGWLVGLLWGRLGQEGTFFQEGLKGGPRSMCSGSPQGVMLGSGNGCFCLIINSTLPWGPLMEG